MYMLDLFRFLLQTKYTFDEFDRRMRIRATLNEICLLLPPKSDV